MKINCWSCVVGFAAVLVVTPSMAAPAVEGSVPPAPVQPLVATPPTQPPARIYVSDVDNLAHLVGNDPVVGPMAQQLVSQRRAAITTGVVGGLIGAGVLVAGLLDTQQDCIPLGQGLGQSCMGHPNFTLFVIGLVTLPVAGFVAYLMSPKRSELLDVVNAWNPRHRDNQFTVDPWTVWTNTQQ